MSPISYLTTTYLITHLLFYQQIIEDSNNGNSIINKRFVNTICPEIPPKKSLMFQREKYLECQVTRGQYTVYYTITTPMSQYVIYVLGTGVLQKINHHLCGCF